MNTLKRYPGLFICCLILLIIITASIIAPFVSKEGPLATSASLRLQPPSAEHIFGTDEYGRDILSRVCYGIRISLFIGSVVVVVTSAIGIITGILCGLFDRLDMVVSRIMDGLMAFPEIILAITLAAIWGSGVRNIIFALSFAYFPKMFRVVRSCVISIKNEEYILSGKAAGASTLRLITKYILPGCLSSVIVQATFCFASAVLSEAALSFLGVGIKDPAPSLGFMVSAGRNFMTVAPWTILIPGGVIMLMV
ncbi:MAG: ABC transporter permease, partial [Clostridiales bacterium]|nr:ABC transporter permease [Clostridiales bacterium]